MDRICAAAILLSLFVTILFMNGEKIGITRVLGDDSDDEYASAYFSQNDLNASWDTSEATVITLEGDSARISGNGAYWLDGSLTIVQSGRYVISGQLTDGNIVVDAQAYSKVWIQLSGVTLSCSDDACLRVNQADKVFVTLKEGTENIFTGAESYSEEATADGTDAVIYSHDDLTINGSGSLSITAACLNGITSKDDMIITGGTISITAPAHGIKANDRFRFTSADLTIDAGQDGIHSDMEFLIEDGSIVIAAEDDGIHADSLIQIYGGTLEITDCYEGLEAVVIEQHAGSVSIHSRDDGLNANGWTGTAMGGPQMGDQSQSEEQATVTAEETYVLIAGGTLTITNTSGMDADGIDSNGNILVTGSTIRVYMENNNGNSALDCGTESGGQAVISGGTVIACGNSAMAESFDSASSQPSILYNISSGVSADTVISLYSADDELLLTDEIPYAFSSVVISCPEMTVGNSYRIVIGENEESITLNEITASFGDVSSQMFQGTMNWGGMQPRQRDQGGTPPTPPDGEAGGTPPELPEGGMGFGPGGENGGTPPALPDGTPPAFPENGDSSMQPMSPPGGMMNNTSAQTESSETSSPAGTDDMSSENTAHPDDTPDAGQTASASETAGMSAPAMPPQSSMQPSSADGTGSQEADTETGAASASQDNPSDADTSETSGMFMQPSGFAGGDMHRQGGFRGQDHPEQGGRFQTDAASADPAADTDPLALPLVLASVILLAAGLIFAALYRRCQHISA